MRSIRPVARWVRVTQMVAMAEGLPGGGGGGVMGSVICPITLRLVSRSRDAVQHSATDWLVDLDAHDCVGGAEFCYVREVQSALRAWAHFSSTSPVHCPTMWERFL